MGLADALLKMVEAGGDEFREEMDRRGLAVLASTIADVHADKHEVARCAMRLLGLMSAELLVRHTEDHMKEDGAIVCLGLEVLNRCVREDKEKLNDVARFDGREMLRDVETMWVGAQMIQLQALNLSRRLK